jgi:hypothetical protein
MMGSNLYGQLGIGEHNADIQFKEWCGAPCLVDTLRDKRIVTISCGKNSSFAIVS